MGKLIVIEGTDGSGKSTQFDLLAQRLEQEGRAFRRLRFPRYDQPSSALIRMYLGGDFGADPDAVNAYAASTFYAVDRYASFVQDWQGGYQGGGLFLSDRYTTSNAVHQGGKVPPQEREGLLGVLSCDPRPPYQKDPGRIYGMAFGSVEVRFTVAEGTLTVRDVEQR